MRAEIWRLSGILRVRCTVKPTFARIFGVEEWESGKFAVSCDVVVRGWR
jgi:hypothetical protein